MLITGKHVGGVIGSKQCPGLCACFVFNHSLSCVLLMCILFCEYVSLYKNNDSNLTSLMFPSIALTSLPRLSISKKGGSQLWCHQGLEWVRYGTVPGPLIHSHKAWKQATIMRNSSLHTASDQVTKKAKVKLVDIQEGKQRHINQDGNR